MSLPAYCGTGMYGSSWTTYHSDAFFISVGEQLKFSMSGGEIANDVY